MKNTEELSQWINTYVENEKITSYDGVVLNTYHFTAPGLNRAVVMVHGFCEFFGKYHELFYRFAKAGYAVYFIELRGHGHSGNTRNYADHRVTVGSFDEYVEDVAAKMMKSRVRSYPVLDARGNIVGGISRWHTRNYNKRKFVLVDHSAMNQTVNNIGNADLLAIIDHHHIGGITTQHPILYRNQRVGCTCTIIATMYQENNILPSHDMAGLLLSAILSDTLNFKSATTTQQDRDTVSWLSEIAGVEDVNAYAREMLGASVALSDSTPEDILYRDLKTYQIGKFTFAIGQTNYSHMEEVQKILPEFKEYLKNEQASKNLDLLVMLFTDVMGEGSMFIYDGPMSYVLSDILETTFDDNSGFDSGIISRKQQLMPRLSEIMKNI